MEGRGGSRCDETIGRWLGAKGMLYAALGGQRAWGSHIVTTADKRCYGTELAVKAELLDLMVYLGNRDFHSKLSCRCYRVVMLRGARG